MFSEKWTKQKEVWEAYRGNLKLVIEEENKLTEELEGKVVLTSDHGNCIGKYGIYAHPPGLRVKELVKVPGVVLKDTEKKIEGIEV